MRRGLLILGAGLLAAVLAYGGFYFAGTTGSRTLLHSSQPELAWLKQEFKLSDAEFARITQLHEAYLPQCNERCRRINALNARLEQALVQASGVTTEVEKLLKERAAERADCQAAMLKHFFEVSRAMPPEQGKLYLAWVEDQTCIREQTMNHGPAATGGEMMMTR